jgi:hypothetical protein
MSNIVLFNGVRENLKNEPVDLEYQAKILGMDKIDLLEEMVRFQEERGEEGQLTPKLIAQGQVLFKALEETAETTELKNLARSYRRHLKYEQMSKVKKASLS